jgi:hypothetical protein
MLHKKIGDLEVIEILMLSVIASIIFVLNIVGLMILVDVFML